MFPPKFRPIRSGRAVRGGPTLIGILLLLTSFAGMTVEAVAACRTASPGAQQWKNEAFPAQAGEFTVQYDVTPQQANMDGLVGLSNGAATGWTRLAAIVRFNREGFIDVRNGAAYNTDSRVNYRANATYHIRMVVNVPAHTYSVWVRGTEEGTAGEVPIASNYSFRTEQLGVTSLNNSVVEAELGNLKVCSFTVASGVQPVRDCATATPGAEQWQTAGLASPIRTGFTAQWDVTPLAAGSDALIALANGPQTTWSGLAAIVRFNRNNTIDVRDGGSYRADTAVPYTPGRTYRITMIGDVADADGYPGHSYSVFVSVDGGARVQIAKDYKFRTEQQAITEINHRIVEAELGGLRACNFFYQIHAR